VRVNFDLDREEHIKLKVHAVRAGKGIADVLRESAPSGKARCCNGAPVPGTGCEALSRRAPGAGLKGCNGRPHMKRPVKPPIIHRCLPARARLRSRPFPGFPAPG
jgi:hypothetical protein